LSVGEELRCSARGNPPPQITLGPKTLVKKAETNAGEGWRSLVVSSDWVGSTFTLECSATNTVDGDESSVSSSVTFNVTGEQFSRLYYALFMLRPLKKCSSVRCPLAAISRVAISLYLVEIFQ